MLHINDLTYRIGGRLLLDRATVAVPEGHRVGIVGRNGAGKTTLLRLIIGELAPESGGVSLPATARIGVVAQEAPGGDTSLIDFVLAADLERADLLARADHATDPQEIADIHHRLAEIGAHAAPARAAAILSGLGFDAEAQTRSLDDFSGGWRMRVALAAILFTLPDVLLLDEPTNHLDLEASLWLEGFLASYPRTLLIISHDRDFLNRAVNHILHVDRGRLTLYRGGYDDFDARRREQLAQRAAEAARVDAQRRHIQSFIDRFRAKASKARQAQSRVKMLERLQPIIVDAEEGSSVFRFPEPKELAPPLMTLDQVAVGYEADKPILRNLDLRIDQDDRIALLGANGNGKSTLAKLLAGKLQPFGGAVRRTQKLNVGFFAQHQMDALMPGKTPVDHLRPLLPDQPEDKLRARLAAFGFAQGKAETKVDDLSGGEKARLALCLCTLSAPELLLLDEPTNHLDVDAREALIQALNDYNGAVVLISHDRHLIDLTADRLLLVEGGRVKPFDGDVDDYARFLMERRRDQPGDRRGDKSSQTRKDERRAAAESRQQLAPLRKQAKDAEKQLEQLERQRRAIEAQLADPAIYGGPAAKVTELSRQKAELDRQIAAAEEAWLEASSALEAAAN